MSSSFDDANVTWSGIGGGKVSAILYTWIGGDAMKVTVKQAANGYILKHGDVTEVYHKWADVLERITELFEVVS